MKKKLVIILIIVSLLAVLFTPIPIGVYKDGGTRVYSALTYKIVDWNRITGESTYSKTHVYFFPNNFKSITSLWETVNAEYSFSFLAKVLEVKNSSVLVEVVEESVWLSFKIGDKVSCGTNQLKNVDAMVGSIVKITYNGFVEETYPPQIYATSWELCKNYEYSFTAKILEISDNSVLVEPIGDGDGISGVDKVEFKTANLPQIDIKVGSKVKITYNGQVMYSLPAQINALSWQLCE